MNKLGNDVLKTLRRWKKELHTVGELTYLGIHDIEEAIEELQRPHRAPITVKLIPNMHTNLIKMTLNAAPRRLNMAHWVSGVDFIKSYCYAGWVLHLSGDRGVELRTRFGHSIAAYIVLAANFPYIKAPRFFNLTDAEGLAQIKANAKLEAKHNVRKAS